MALVEFLENNSIDQVRREALRAKFCSGAAKVATVSSAGIDWSPWPGLSGRRLASLSTSLPASPVPPLDAASYSTAQTVQHGVAPNGRDRVGGTQDRREESTASSRAGSLRHLFVCANGVVWFGSFCLCATAWGNLCQRKRSMWCEAGPRVHPRQ